MESARRMEIKKLKILYIGNFTDGTGWAKAGTYNALCLDHAGHDVYCRELKYSSNNLVLDPRIIELMEKVPPNDIELVVHHVLPTEYIKYPNVKNVGAIELETVSLHNVQWIKSMNLMDEMWVPNQSSKKSLMNEKIHKNVKTLEHSIDVQKIANSPYQPIPELQNAYNFLFVGENVIRKNLEMLIAAFYSEFNAVEKVNLVIKTNKRPDLDKIWQETRNINSKRKDIFLIDEYLPEEKIYNLMRNCHLFVMPSSGESCCFPALEASCLGLRILLTQGIASQEYCTHALSIQSHIDQCYGSLDGLTGLYTSQDIWYRPEMLSLRRQMRSAYSAYLENHAVYGNNMKYYDYRDTRKLREVI